MITIVLESVENIVEKRENAYYQYLHSFLECFLKLCLSELPKHGLCGKVLILYHATKFLTSSNSKHLAQIFQICFKGIEDIVGKGENMFK